MTTVYLPRYASWNGAYVLVPAVERPTPTALRPFVESRFTGSSCIAELDWLDVFSFDPTAFTIAQRYAVPTSRVLFYGKLRSVVKFEQCS